MLAQTETGPLDASTHTALAGCLNISEDALAGYLRFGEVWEFLDALGAPNHQMLDRSLVYWDDVPDKPLAHFAWEIFLDY